MRSEEHTSELQSPLIISYAVFCLPTASSLFLLFLYLRNLLLKIFSELDETFCGIFIRQDQDRDRRGALEATHRAGAASCRGSRWGRDRDPALALVRPLDPLRRL